MRFRDYHQMTEAYSRKESGDLSSTLRKLPKAHRQLLRGYKFDFQGGNTLKGEKDNVGSNDFDKKHIIIAAPWNYGREFAILHEIGHLVWQHLMCDHDKQRWGQIVKNTKDKLRQCAEELFCHAYANTHAKNKIEVHNHKSWEKFVKNL